MRYDRPFDLAEWRIMRIIVLLAAALALSGCLARTAVDVVTLPVKAVGAGADALTTSQEEADRNRGRELRKQEKREAKERRREMKRAARDD